MMYKIGKHNVEMYDNIEELPIKRFHAYNKMLLIDAGIGGDLADFDTHCTKVMAYIQARKNEQAIQEMQNLRQNVYMMQKGIAPKMLAFACLVKSIDDKRCDDITESGLQSVVAQLEDATTKEITTSLEAVKKKIDETLRLYFPKIFDNAEEKEYYDILKKRTAIILDGIAKNNKKNEKELSDITNSLLTYNTPQNFAGAESVEIKFDKNFERMCATISQYLHADPKKYTVLEFYNAFEYVKDLAKTQNKSKNAKKGTK